MMLDALQRSETAVNGTAQTAAHRWVSFAFDCQFVMYHLIGQLTCSGTNTRLLSVSSKHDLGRSGHT